MRADGGDELAGGDVLGSSPASVSSPKSSSAKRPRTASDDAGGVASHDRWASSMPSTAGGWRTGAPARRALARGVADDAYSVALGSALWAMQQDDLFTDASVAVDGQIFRCHRVVLSAGSGLFRAMFAGGLREASAQAAEVHDVAADTFAKVLEFLYTGEAKLAEEAEAEAVLVAADLLDVKALRACCADWLHDHLTPRNCARVWGTAERLYLEPLAQRARDLLANSLMQNDEALVRDLAPHHLAELLELDSLAVTSEDQVVALLSAWVQVCASKRQREGGQSGGRGGQR